MPYLTQQLLDHKGPVVAATDYIKAYTDQIREFVPRSFTVLGTDGFGRSDTRRNLRQHFEVSREFIVVAALTALVDEGAMSREVIATAMVALGIDTNKRNPRLA